MTPWTLREGDPSAPIPRWDNHGVADDPRIWVLGGFRAAVGGRPVPPDAWQRSAAAALVKLLAVTPGLRDVLPMRRLDPHVRAGLHRAAAALVLRDRAMEVSGVQSVRVRVGRKRVDVRAVSHFRELDEVRGDLDATLADGIRGLGLARPPALSVHVRRPGRKG